MKEQSLELVSNSNKIKPIIMGDNNPVFTIAEIGLNHNGDLEIGKKMIDAAHNAGCSSVKFQNFETDHVYIKGEKAGKYKLLGKDIEIYNLHKQLEIEYDFLSELKKYSEEKGMYFFSAPMGDNALKTLVDLDCDLVKIASYEVTNLPWIKKVAEIGKPIIMSCGGARLEEVDRAVNEIMKIHDKLALMHCVIKYPAPIYESNLKIMNTLKSAFEIPVGFSNNGFEHSDGRIDFQTVPRAAASMGMDLYEIHITLDREMEGVDQGFSTEPDELKSMIDLINKTRSDYLAGNPIDFDERCIGSGKKRILECEKYVRDFAYKSIFSIKKISAGEKLDETNIKCLRPGEYIAGLEPLHYENLIKNSFAKEDIEAFEPITFKDISFK